MNIENETGSRIDPWGTPQIKGAGEKTWFTNLNIRLDLDMASSIRKIWLKSCMCSYWYSLVADLWSAAHISDFFSDPNIKKVKQNWNLVWLLDNSRYIQMQHWYQAETECSSHASTCNLWHSWVSLLSAVWLSLIGIYQKYYCFGNGR